MTLACRLVVVAFVATLYTACSISYTPQEVTRTLASGLERGRQYHEIGNDVEAAELLAAVEAVDAELPEARNLRTQMGRIPALEVHPLLGSNVARRPRIRRSLGMKTLLYLPDRLLDLFDIVSFDVHVGYGLFANAHVTRAVQFGLGGRGVGGVGWHDQRSLGALAQAESEATIPGIGTQAYVAALAGTPGVRTVSNTVTGLHRPSNTVYQRLRDYWAVGAAATLADVGADIDFHPVELADWLLGWGTLDFLRDDFATTRGLRFEREDTRVLGILSRVQRSPETLEAYRRWRDR